MIFMNPTGLRWNLVHPQDPIKAEYAATEIFGGGSDRIGNGLEAGGACECRHGALPPGTALTIGGNL